MTGGLCTFMHHGTYRGKRQNARKTSWFSGRLIHTLRNSWNSGAGEAWYWHGEVRLVQQCRRDRSSSKADLTRFRKCSGFKNVL